MTRPLIAIDSGDTRAVEKALRAALTADGPAVFPYPGVPQHLPKSVDQRVALVVETSGSTSRPKRVALSADAMLASAASVQSALGAPGDWALVMPLHYIAGINVVVRAIASGAEFVPQDQERSFDALRFAAALEARPVNFAAVVPTQLNRLLASDEGVAALRSLDRILVGGQAVSVETRTRLAELELEVVHTYGASETSGGCVWDGIPIGDTQIRIVDGHIELATSALAEGYLDDPLRTMTTFREDGGRRWYRTDDTGVIVDGVLKVTGRVDDMIVSGGHKISIAEVELAARALPGLADSIVVAAPHPEWGETPVLVTTATVQLAEVRDAIAERLGRPAAPTRVIVVPSIPLLSSGKPDRLGLAMLARQ